MSLNDFLIEKKLGDGAFSTVYAVKRISDGERYALKKVKMGKLTEKEKENVRNKLAKQIEESEALAKEKDNQIKNIETQLMTIK